MGEAPAFLCDAMLGGLARWLRAAGYQARFDVHVADGELVRRAFERQEFLLTSDSGILQRYAVAEGLVGCLYIPQGLDPIEQLGHVLGRLNLPRKEPRCMDCGGRLLELEPEAVRREVPPGARKACEEFSRCADCEKVYWRGTHWDSIEESLRRATRLAARDKAARGEG